MSDSVSTRLQAALADRYRLDRELGAGGMATVYLAHDLKHQRDVAIKVLHPDLGAALGGERFLTEIRTTARLQHPHILPLLDSGDAGDGLLYYVMPLVTGETLRARLTRERQLPIPEAIRIAREVAGALDYAHRQGVIHRDIKPENILLHDGSALVADFGIALAVQSAGGQRMTQTGLSLGTPQYMSPEQAMGERTIDARTDIYALGAVTYEMLAGDPPFTGSNVQAIVAKVLNERPTPLATLRDTCPAGVEAAVLSALAKLPADRFESAKAFADALQEGRSGGYATGIGSRSGAANSAARSSRVPLYAMGAVTVASLAIAAWALKPASSAAVAPSVQFTLEPPNGGADLGRFAVSGDGTKFAFSTDEGIMLRDAGQREYRLLSGTAAGESPSFSPDGDWIVYETNGRLRKVPVAGGTPIALISGDSIRSGRVNWGEDGTIVFETGSRMGLVSPTGALRIVAKAKDVEQPRMTPDGKGVLYVDNHAGAKLMYFDLALDTAFMIVEEAAEGTLLSTGHLVYGSTAGGLYAVRFNQAKHAVEGTPTPVVLDVQPNGGVAPFVITRSGMLVYRAGVDAESRVHIRAPNGAMDTLPIAPKVLSYARFSPDGSQLALTIGSARGTNRHVAIYNFATHTFERFTTEGGGHSPVWSPDGKRLAFTAESPETDAEDIFVQPVDRSTPPKRMPRMPNDQHGNDWPDDTTLVYSTNMAARTLGGRVGGGMTGTVNPLTGTGERVYLEAPWGQFSAVISPDRHWAAFTSLQSGKSEVHVRPYPVATAGPEVTITGDGVQPRWSGDGRTIYYETADFTQVRATHVTPGATFVVGASETLLSRPALGVAWDVDKKTGRMVVTEPVTAAGVRLVVMQHWLDGFRQKLAEKK
jgi:serine/threonine-protein kinase